MDSLQQLIDASLRQLKSRCTINGVFDSKLLDEHQQVCYDLALCVAELHAGRALADYSRQLADNALAQSVVRSFIAEVKHTVLARLLAHGVELALPATTLQNAITASLAEGDSSAELEAIGVALQEPCSRPMISY